MVGSKPKSNKSSGGSSYQRSFNSNNNNYYKQNDPNKQSTYANQNRIPNDNGGSYKVQPSNKNSANTLLDNSNKMGVDIIEQTEIPTYESDDQIKSVEIKNK